MDNKKSFVFKLAVLIGIAALSTGCITRLGSFTVLSTRNIDWSRAGEFQRGSKVDGKDIMHMIVFIPTKLNITIEEAVDNALDKVPGAVALVDVVLKNKVVLVPPLYYQEGFIVEGSVLIDPKLAASKTDESKYYIGICNNKKDIEMNEVSETEYENIKAKIKS